jgi:DNA-binding beta-propeller fold protein YncE
MRRVLSTLAIGLITLVAPLRAEFAYVANSSTNNVSGFRIRENGALTPLPGSPFAVGVQPILMTVDPVGQFLYLANFHQTIYGFRIGENGALTPLPGSPVAVGVQPTSNGS